MARPPGFALIGIDLAWSDRHPSGVAALVPARGGLRIAALETRVPLEAIVAFVAAHRAETTVVMVDAPLVVRNRSGRRPAESELHRRFHRQQAGAHAANRRLLSKLSGGRPRGERLGEALADLGFPWPPGELPLRGARGRHLFECYPHPAHVVVFGLDRTLKYKKKRQGWDACRREFGRYLALVRGLERPRIVFDAFALDWLDIEGQVGQGYKAREDRLDALFCAWLGALALDGRLETVGDAASGAIVIPRASEFPAPPAAARVPAAR
jgi:predicted RNase H-like nuclease